MMSCNRFHLFIDFIFNRNICCMFLIPIRQGVILWDISNDLPLYTTSTFSIIFFSSSHNGDSADVFWFLLKAKILVYVWLCICLFPLHLRGFAFCRIGSVVQTYTFKFGFLTRRRTDRTPTTFFDWTILEKDTLVRATCSAFSVTTGVAISGTSSPNFLQPTKGLLLLMLLLFFRCRCDA